MLNLFSARAPSTMHLRYSLVATLGFAMVGCGSSGTDESGQPLDDEFNPPAVAEGFQRLVSPIIEKIEPGSDQTYCQYVFGAFDRDVDVLEVTGFQSKYGHHVVAYGSSVKAPLGTSRICNVEDNTEIGSFLGGGGGEAGGATNLPDGVAFRLVKGNSIMLNTHFVNTGRDAVKGESVLDIKFVEADPSRSIASMFVNINIGFSIPARTEGTAEASCVLPQDMDLVMFTNHLHALGTSIYTEVTSPGGQPRTIHADPQWSYEMQFNPDFTRWNLDSTFSLKKGDVVHTHCAWNNIKGAEAKFPDEMCVGIGFFLSKANTSPTCINGAWLER